MESAERGAERVDGVEANPRRRAPVQKSNPCTYRLDRGGASRILDAGVPCRAEYRPTGIITESCGTGSCHLLPPALSLLTPTEECRAAFRLA